MKSKTLIAAILPTLLLLSCTPKKSKEELSHLDSTSPEHFVQSVIDNRKDAYADSGEYDITGKAVFSLGDFHILNFTEHIGKESHQYAILINPDKASEIDSTEKSIRVDFRQLLKKQTGLAYRILEGNIEPSKDLLGDGSPDFVLAQSHSSGNDTKSEQVIILYDGKKKLTETAIIARSGYKEESNKSIFTGAKEILEFKEGNPVTIVIHHTDDSLGLKPVRYEQRWRWSGKDSAWQTGFAGTDLDNPVFKKFNQRLTYLEDNAGTFTIPENCQSGGPIYFELKRSDPSDLSDYYLVRTGIEDAGYNLIFQAVRKDSLTYVLYKARGEKSTGTKLQGETEIRRDSSDAIIIIKNDLVRRDIYWLTYSYNPTGLPYTSAPKRYRFLKCQ